MPAKKTTTTTETFKIRGEELVKKVKELLKEGSIRRIIIKDKTGKGILDIPLTFGVVGAVIAPVLAVAGTVAALITECTISVERDN